MSDENNQEDNNKTKKTELFSEKDKTELASTGAPIPYPIKHLLETSLGQDLSHVKVSTGNEAGRMSTLLSAKAFSMGDHILFNKGAYLPGNPESNKLLGHEVAHVVQQKQGHVKPQQ